MNGRGVHSGDVVELDTDAVQVPCASRSDSRRARREPMRRVAVAPARRLVELKRLGGSGALVTGSDIGVLL